MSEIHHGNPNKDEINDKVQTERNYYLGNIYYTTINGQPRIEGSYKCALITSYMFIILPTILFYVFP